MAMHNSKTLANSSVFRVKFWWKANLKPVVTLKKMSTPCFEFQQPLIPFKTIAFWPLYSVARMATLSSKHCLTSAMHWSDNFCNCFLLKIIPCLQQTFRPHACLKLCGGFPLKFYPCLQHGMQMPKDQCFNMASNPINQKHTNGWCFNHMTSENT